MDLLVGLVPGWNMVPCDTSSWPGGVVFARVTVANAIGSDKKASKVFVVALKQ
jgi:hypothetical protein